MPAQHGAHLAAASLSLSGCCAGVPRPPGPWAEGGHGEGLPGASLLQGLPRSGPPCQGTATTPNTGRCPKGRATSAQCLMAPLDLHTAKILEVSSLLLREPRASVSPSCAQPQPFHGVESAWFPTPHTDPSAHPHPPHHQNKLLAPILD